MAGKCSAFSLYVVKVAKLRGIFPTPGFLAIGTRAVSHSEFVAAFETKGKMTVLMSTLPTLLLLLTS